MAEDQPYTFLYTPLGLSALQKKFFIVEKDGAGNERLEPIKMEKAGLTYDLTKWMVPRQTVLEQ